MADAKAPGSSSVVINVKQPENAVGTLAELQFPALPTQMGKVTETIKKSTLTETIVTRVTNNKLGSLPIIIEVYSSLFLKTNQYLFIINAPVITELQYPRKVHEKMFTSY